MPQPLNPDVRVAAGGGEVRFRPSATHDLTTSCAHDVSIDTFAHVLVPFQMVAVLQFSGYAVREAAESARQRLIQALEYGEHSWTPQLTTCSCDHG